MIQCSLDDVWPKHDLIMSGRTVAVDLGPVEIDLIEIHQNPTRIFDAIPHYRIGNGTGVAFPELLRAYAKLFTEVADFVQNTLEPSPDFQI